MNHPNVGTLYDVGPNYLVMDLVEGETIAALLKRGPLPMKTALLYASQILAGLAEAHSKGIVHRDLKPGNVMIAKSGVKVLDFGLAKSGTDDTVTASHMAIGTPAYMAPEQREGRPADVRTDIYAFGCMLYPAQPQLAEDLAKRFPEDTLFDSSIFPRCARSLRSTTRRLRMRSSDCKRRFPTTWPCRVRRSVPSSEVSITCMYAARLPCGGTCPGGGGGFSKSPQPSRHWEEHTLPRATRPGPNAPIRISSPSGRMPTRTSPSSNRPGRNTRSYRISISARRRMRQPPQNSAAF